MFKQVFALLVLVAIVSAQKESFIKVSVDDFLRGIKINNMDVDIASLPNRNNYNVPDTLRLATLLKEGDKITIIAENAGQFGKPNPGNLIAEIQYYNANGEAKLFLTNPDDWICNGMAPASHGELKAERPSLGVSGKWIWSSNLEDKISTCVGIIPFENGSTLKLDADSSICFPINYTDDVLSQPRDIIEFSCRLIDQFGRNVDQDDISKLIHSGRVNIKFEKQDADEKITHEVAYIQSDSIVNFKVNLLTKALARQSVRYDVGADIVQMVISLI